MTGISSNLNQFSNMKIPSQFIGNWIGPVFDLLPENSYKGEIVISQDTINTIYYQKQGTQYGLLEVGYNSAGFLVMSEKVGSFSGSLLLYLRSENELECIWTSRSKFQCQSTMLKTFFSNHEV